jgi:hypothetical protein
VVARRTGGARAALSDSRGEDLEVRGGLDSRACQGSDSQDVTENSLSGCWHEGYAEALKDP